MIELSVKELTESVEVFKTLLEMKFNGRTAYLLARIMREVEKEYMEFNNTRADLILKYCAKDENGMPITDEKGNNVIEKNNINDFNKELSEILNTRVTLNIDPISLNDIKTLDFSTNQMYGLMPFIEE